MVLRSHMPDVIIPDVTFSELILSRLQANGEEIALVEPDENGKALTYKEIYESIIKCAAAFNKLGVVEGDVIAVSLGNRSEFPIVVIAAAACGAILTTCNPMYTKDEVTKQFTHSRPSIVVVENSSYDKLKAVAQNVDSIKHIFTVKPAPGCISITELLANADRRDFPFDRRPDTSERPFYLPYSSGTTGLPKGVMLTQKNMNAVVVLTSIIFEAGKTDCFYLVLPLFHIYGTMSIFSCLILGIKIVLQQRFSVKSFLESVQNYKVTRVAAVPPMILAIYNSPLLAEYDTSSLQKMSSGAAPLPTGVGEDVKKKLKCELIQGWGLTEAVPLVSTSDKMTPLSSIGRVIPNTLIKIVDTETAKELSSNQSGEVCVKGPQVMKGYYKNPEATRNSIDVDGWFHTGDIGYFDEYGRIYIVDRLKELIKVKGFQVAPAELEELLLRHPSITDVAVIGIPHPALGEAPKAFLVVNDKRLTKAEVNKFVEGRVSSYKYLKGGIEFCDIIPKSASGKILRRQLKNKASHL